jgi:hypothetical protein
LKITFFKNFKKSKILQKIFSRPLYFDAEPFSVDTYKAGLVSMYENELLITFRTFENGIFFFSLADQGDMLIVQLVRGRVEAIFDFGSLSRSTITGGRALNDGEWHELKWVHQFDSVHLYVDGILVNSTIPSGLYRKLDFNFQVAYICSAKNSIFQQKLALIGPFLKKKC